MNTSNNQQPQTIRPASEKQTAFIAALFQSIDWKAITMQEASATIRALLKVRDAHKPAKERKADKKKVNKEKETTTNKTTNKEPETKAVKAESTSAANAPEAPKAETPETVSAEIVESKPAESGKKGKKGKTVYISYLWHGEPCKVPADVVQDLGDGLAYVTHQDLERKSGGIIDVATGLNVLAESTKAKTFQKWENEKAVLLPKIHEIRKAKNYKAKIQRLEALPVAHEFVEEAAKRAAERAAKRAEQGKKTLSVHRIDGQNVARCLRDMGLERYREEVKRALPWVKFGSENANA